ncbi:hypothetical protein B0O99DRAFT_267301 [Bisporella sp. PMI_857]|nr:hypothetical protein B0O99DRAFT_267301 [Bisporella sp. PMI_857]
MDPLTALSAAAAIVQFVDYGISVVSKTAKLYTSSTGALVENAELQEASERLVDLSRSLKASTNEQENKAIQNICDSCMALSDDLISKLAKLRLMGSQKGRKWHSFRQALKSVYSKTEINEISHRLESFRTELTMHILLTLR